MARLLIVEDHPELADLMVAAAESRGHEATAVHTGEAALALLRPAAFDAAVVDLLLPDIRGSAVLAALREHAIPSIAMSGVFKGDRFAREATEVHGARAFFEKPFELPHLLESVEQLCGLAPPPPPEEDEEVMVFEDASMLDLDDEPGFVAEEDEPIFSPAHDEAPVIQGLTVVEEVEDPMRIDPAVFDTPPPATEPPIAEPSEMASASAPESLEAGDGWHGQDSGDGVESESQSAYVRETPITLKTMELESLVALEELEPESSAPPSPAPSEARAALDAPAPSSEPPPITVDLTGEQAALDTLDPEPEPSPAPTESAEELAALDALGPAPEPSPAPTESAEELAALDALGPAPEPSPAPAESAEELAALDALGPAPEPSPTPTVSAEEQAALDALGAETPPAPAVSEEQAALDALGASGEEALASAPEAAAPASLHPEPEPGIALPFGDREKVWNKTDPAGEQRRPPPAWSLSGDLKHTSVPRLLNAYYEARHSGELKLRQGTLQKVIYFEAGRPVYAASNLAHERFLRFCVRRGVLKEAQAQQAATLAREQGLRSSEALLRLGLMDAARRVQLVTEQVKDLLGSTLSWTEGAYGFSPMRPPRAGLVKLSVFPGDLILEGTLRTEHLVSLRQRMPRSRRLFPAAAPPYGLHELTLQGPQALLLAYADGSKTVEDLLTLTDMSERDVLATLRGLELIGVLEERRDEPGNRRRISFGL